MDEADVEEEKRDLITREIGKFREIMKVSSLFTEKRLGVLFLQLHTWEHSHISIKKFLRGGLKC